MNRTHLKLGLKPADHSRPAVSVSRALAAIPAHPASADNGARITDWGMLGNDKFGDCGPCGVAHARMQVTTYLSPWPYVATEAQTLDFYAQVDPQFDPATGEGDDGVNLQDMLQVAANNGFNGVKPVAFAKVDHSNLEEVRAAIAVFGSVLFGVDLQVAQQQQQVWDYEQSDPWGGHCVLAVSYNSSTSGSDVGVVTWGEVIGVTDAFMTHQLSECFAVIWPEHLGSEEFLTGLDVAQLAADYHAITGRTLAPGLTPATDPGDVP